MRSLRGECDDRRGEMEQRMAKLEREIVLEEPIAEGEQQKPLASASEERAATGTALVNAFSSGGSCEGDQMAAEQQQTAARNLQFILLLHCLQQQQNEHQQQMQLELMGGARSAQAPQNQPKMKVNLSRN